MSVPPVALTRNATNIRAQSATLNGTAGAGVAGGDPTQWFFQYGTTTAYGRHTPPQTLGACLPGHTAFPPGYCTTPATAPVSARVSGLSPCTRYHFRLVATNPDGTTRGHDKTFKTKAERPSVTAPRRVRRRGLFKVRISLSAPGRVAIFIRGRHFVEGIRLGFHRAGSFSVRLRAPRRRGAYILTVIERESCGTQRASTLLRVH